MQKQQLINWISNILRKNILNSNEGYELETKIGQFIPKNYPCKRYLESLKGLEQLNKNEYKYEFQSKISQSSYDKAQKYFIETGQPIKYTKRLDFIFNVKEQRSSLFITDDTCQAILIHKKKKMAQHLDIMDNGISYRVSLNLEKPLSSSLKDILAQMPSRKNNIGHIRIKETLIMVQDNLEFALSKVKSFTKAQDEFQIIINNILESKFYNIKQVLEKLFDTQMKNPQYELEIEVMKSVQDEEVDQVSNNFIEKTEEIAKLLSVQLVKKDNGDEVEIQKKVKVNEDI